MTWWEELAEQLAEQQLTTQAVFVRLMLDLWERLQAGKPSGTLAQALEQGSTQRVTSVFTLAGAAQYGQLNPAGRELPLLDAPAQKLGQKQGQLVCESAERHLLKATERMVSPYARLAAQILVTDAARTGLRAGAILGEATHKRFVRVRPVKEPRAHSALEGVVKPISEPYIIAGIPVHGPGDAALPWSERAWCGHALEYLRLSPQGGN